MLSLAWDRSEPACTAVSDQKRKAHDRINSNRTLGQWRWSAGLRHIHSGDAWQSIFLNVAGFALWVVLVIVTLLSPSLIWFMVMIVRLLIFLALFAAWLICVMKALNGVRFRLPIIGALADKQAGN
jgi:uncharacterized membrane protein